MLKSTLETFTQSKTVKSRTWTELVTQFPVLINVLYIAIVWTIDCDDSKFLSIKIGGLGARRCYLRSLTWAIF
jgi:hypothetical protein